MIWYLHDIPTCVTCHLHDMSPVWCHLYDMPTCMIWHLHEIPLVWRIVNCLIAPPRNILTYLLTYLWHAYDMIPVPYHTIPSRPPWPCLATTSTEANLTFHLYDVSTWCNFLEHWSSIMLTLFPTFQQQLALCCVWPPLYTVPLFACDLVEMFVC